jgi:hypothetical protein
MISRHPDNEDFVGLGLDRICDRVSNYEEFERLVLAYRGAPFGPEKQQEYREFLARNSSRQRALQLLHDLDGLNGLRAS